MPTDCRLTKHWSGATWAGWIITGLVVFFLTFDGTAKIIRIAPVVEASERLRVPQHAIVGIGILLLAATAICAIPQTAVLGAILLTGYLGGAVAVQVRAGSAFFPTVFPIAFGLLAWAGLILRVPRLLWTILRGQ
jgi:hypothetical protein